MRISYRAINWVFIIVYILPIAILGYFVRERIQERQVIVQLFLKNQADVDRQIIANRQILSEAQVIMRKQIGIAPPPPPKRIKNIVLNW